MKKTLVKFTTALAVTSVLLPLGVSALAAPSTSNFEAKTSIISLDVMVKAKAEALAKVSTSWKANSVEDVKAEIKRQEDAGYKAYVIQWGDTLGAIATATGQTVEDLVQKNKLVGDQLETGDLLDGVLGKATVATSGATQVAKQPVGPSTQPSVLRTQNAPVEQAKPNQKPTGKQEPAIRETPSEEKPVESQKPQESKPAEDVKPSESKVDEPVKPDESKVEEPTKPAESSTPQEESKPEESKPVEESKPSESVSTPEESKPEESTPTPAESTSSVESQPTPAEPTESSSNEDTKPEESKPTEQPTTPEKPVEEFKAMPWKFTGKVDEDGIGEFEDPREFKTEDEAIAYGYSMIAATGKRTVEEASASLQRATGGAQFKEGTTSSGFESTQGMDNPNWTVFHKIEMSQYLNK